MGKVIDMGEYRKGHFSYMNEESYRCAVLSAIESIRTGNPSEAEHTLSELFWDMEKVLNGAGDVD